MEQKSLFFFNFLFCLFKRFVFLQSDTVYIELTRSTGRLHIMTPLMEGAACGSGENSFTRTQNPPKGLFYLENGMFVSLWCINGMPVHISFIGR